MSRQWLVRMLTCLMMASTAVAQAEVVRSAETGFTVNQTVNVTMPPTAAWSALSDIGRWWDPEQSYSGDARNMTLEPYVGGCFCEKMGMYAGVQHMRVIAAQPGKMLRLTGALGPLQEFAITGNLTWTIEVAGGGSRINMVYTASGYADRPLSQWAPIVDSVLASLMQRLGRFISTGNPGETKNDNKRD